MTTLAPANLAPPVRPPAGSASCAGTRRRGFTLVEMVLSISIMSILLLGISSAILLASKALPSPTSLARQRADTTTALNQLSADLACATTITELTATAIAFTVADRGHGAAGPETIRWAWSGTAGAALTRSYNGSAPVTIASNVTAFSLAPTLAAGTLTSAPKVLMVVNNPSLLTTDDNARIAKLTKWAFPVTLISASATQAQFDAAFALCDVVYLPAGTYSLTLSSRLINPSVGIVNENEQLYSAIGVSTVATIYNDSKVNLANIDHDITRGLITGDKDYLTAREDLHQVGGTVSPDLIGLSNSDSKGDLAVLECGARQHDNTTTRSRRVVLPWGGSTLNPCPFNVLVADARTILKRSLFWAAAPSVYDAMQVSLKIGSGTATVTRVELLNQPKVPRP